MRFILGLTFLIPTLSCAAVTFTNNQQNLRVPNSPLLNLGIAQTPTLPDPLNDGLYTSTDFTLEAWVKPAESARNQSFKFALSKNNGGSGYALLMIGKNHDQRWQLESDSVTSYGFQNGYNERAFRNQWFHIAGVKKQNKLYIFINGVFSADFTMTGPTRLNDLPLWIGSSPFDNSSFTGSIAELRLWRTARSHLELVQFMHRSLSGNEDSLVAYYPLQNDFENKANREINGTVQRYNELDAHPVNQPPAFSPGPQLQPSLAELAARAPKIKIIVDGQPVKFRKGAEPLLLNGRAYAAVCTMSLPLAVTMSRYNGGRHTITIQPGGRYLKGTIPVGAYTCLLNGAESELPEPAIIVDRSTPGNFQTETYFPLTYITQTLDHKTKWDDKTQTVYITAKRQ